MKRLHVHVSVEDLERSIRFYGTLFDTPPVVVKPDYARWMLEDPRVNFSISARGRRPGVDHLGIQGESAGELADLGARLRRAEAPVLEVGETTCCYARSEKSWVHDPEGIAWEAFLTHGDATVYGHDTDADLLDTGAGACCPGDAPMDARGAGPSTACC